MAEKLRGYSPDCTPEYVAAWARAFLYIHGGAERVNDFQSLQHEVEGLKDVLLTLLKENGMEPNEKESAFVPTTEQSKEMKAGQKPVGLITFVGMHRDLLTIIQFHTDSREQTSTVFLPQLITRYPAPAVLTRTERYMLDNPRIDKTNVGMFATALKTGVEGILAGVIHPQTTTL